MPEPAARPHAVQTALTSPGHIPVLPSEVLAALGPRAGGTVVDCTVGRGGHAAAIARALGPNGVVVGVDLDGENLRFAAGRVTELGAARFVGIHASFADAPARLRELGLRADGVLADLGFSSTQIDDPQRGLSFAGDGPLDMRYDRSRGRTAAELLAKLSERELCDLIRKLGEDPLAPRIAHRIVQLRRTAPLRTTRELAELVRSVYGARARQSRLHPATRTFMALRIAVNDELNALAALLREVVAAAEALASHDAAIDDAPPVSPVSAMRRAAACASDAQAGAGWLKPGARVAIIAFHSLEDRLVKHAFADLVARGLATRVTHKPVMAGDAELAGNPRARPAKLRAIAIGPVDAIRHGRAGDGPADERDDDVDDRVESAMDSNRAERAEIDE
ncbi:MAG: 16S rRNA (cytosine(1402)-N(4))-methyltransferase RsmH [Phycisphaerales bacterium]